MDLPDKHEPDASPKPVSERGGLRLLPWVTLAIAASFLAAHNWYLQPWTLDDAYISFRYAENFALGRGMVYNEGEYVEGYTTFLWVLMLGLGRTAGADIEILAKLLGTVFAAGCLLLLTLSHRFLRGGDPKASALATLMLGTCGVFTAWVMGGMEVPLAAFLTLLAVLLHLRARETGAPADAVLTGAACAFSAMARPEGLLVAAIAGLDHLLAGKPGRLRRTVCFALPLALLFAPYFAWRFWYYGGWLFPNTFYAKVGDNAQQLVRGWGYTAEFIVTALPITAPALVGLLAAGGLQWRRGPVPLVSALIFAHTLYVIAVGGDAMPAFRFFSTMLPLICLRAALVLLRLAAAPRGLFITGAVILLYNAAQIGTNAELRDRIVKGDVGKHGKVVGLWMREHLPSDFLLATNTAGSVPYFSKLRTIDMLGLNDAAIAHRYIPSVGKGFPGHEKGDGAYVLSRRPDVVHFGSASGSQKPRFLSDREMFAAPEFRRDYLYKVFQLPGRQVLRLYIRKDKLARIYALRPTASSETEER